MYKNILIPVDLAHKKAVGRLVGAAKALADEGVRMTLLYVMTEIPSVVASEMPAGSREKAKANAEADLKTIAADSGAPSDATTMTRVGRPHHNILETAEKIGADLIIVASHQPDFSDYLLGSTAARVVRHANCSVHVLR